MRCLTEKRLIEYFHQTVYIHKNLKFTFQIFLDFDLIVLFHTQKSFSNEFHILILWFHEFLNQWFLSSRIFLIVLSVASSSRSSTHQFSISCSFSKNLLAQPTTMYRPRAVIKIIVEYEWNLRNPPLHTLHISHSWEYQFLFRVRVVHLFHSVFWNTYLICNVWNSSGK